MSSPPKVAVNAEHLLRFYFSPSVGRIHADYMDKSRLAEIVAEYYPRLKEKASYTRKIVEVYCHARKIPMP
jgi:hypothetical protein